MKKIGIIDYYIDEWHSNTYLGLFERAAKELKLDYEIAYGWAEMDRFEQRLSTQEWCDKNGIIRCDTIEELCEKSDNILILSPANPEKHLPYAEVALRYGKATYIDKTFAENVEVAKKIYALAEKYNTQIFSTSALRYVDELNDLKNVESLTVTGGGRSLEEYIIHQIEMTVKLLGADAKSVQVFDRNRHSTVLVEFGEGKIATLNYSTYAPFVVDAAVAGEAGTQYKRIESSEYFYHLIESILVFFKSEKPPFDAAQTIAAIAIRDAIVKGKALPFGSKVDVVK